MILILILFITAPMANAFGSKKQRPAIFKKNKVNMMYDKKINTSFIKHKKYPYKLGIAIINDNRLTPFYHKCDNYFTEDIMSGLRKTITRELKGSNIFNKVKEIPIKLEHPIKKRTCLETVRDYDVDMIFLIDLSTFNLIRGMTEDEINKLKGVKNY